MNDKIIELEEYKNLIQYKKSLDDKNKAVDDLSLEELEDIRESYKKDVLKLSKEVTVLEEENKSLRRLLEK